MSRMSGESSRVNKPTFTLRPSRMRFGSGAGSQRWAAANRCRSPVTRVIGISTAADSRVLIQG